MRLNRRRAALSLALVGIVVAPLATGALRRFISKPTYAYTELVEDKETEFLEAHGLGKYSCLSGRTMDGVPSDLCREADAIPNVYAERRASNLPGLLASMALGLIPALALLVLPPVLSGYYRWVTGGHAEKQNRRP